MSSSCLLLLLTVSSTTSSSSSSSSSCPTDQPDTACIANHFGVSLAEVTEVVRSLEGVGKTSTWLKALFQPNRTLLVIDMQNDFITGSLKVDGAVGIVAPVGELIEKEELWGQVVFSADWHPQNHISFFSNWETRDLDSEWRQNHPGEINMFDQVVFATSLPERPQPYNQTLWPDHCKQQSQGAEFHADLPEPQPENVLRKGTNPEVDSYSAFFDNTGKEGAGSTGLAEQISGSTEVVVVGLATDYCVGSSALHSLKEGFPTSVLEDLAKPVAAATGATMLTRVRGAGGLVDQSDNWQKSLETWCRARELARFYVDRGGLAVCESGTGRVESNQLMVVFSVLSFSLMSLLI